MTTGPQHYAEAERLLTAKGDGFVPDILAEAQVHATLALAAATALQHFNGAEIGMNQDDRQAWLRTASEKPAADAARRQAERNELAEYEVSTARWFAEARAAGCTATRYNIQDDTLNHDGAPACPVHEPGDVVPAEQRQENDR